MLQIQTLFLYLGPIDHVFEETHPTIQVILNKKKIRIWIQIRILFGSSSGLIFLTYLMLFIDFSYKIHSNSTKFTILSNKKSSFGSKTLIYEQNTENFHIVRI